LIADDWSVAKVALQIIAEQGPGLLVAQAEADENRKLAPLLRLMS
jgi:hypothetical protein